MKQYVYTVKFYTYVRRRADDNTIINNAQDALLAAMTCGTIVTKENIVEKTFTGKTKKIADEQFFQYLDDNKLSFDDYEVPFGGFVTIPKTGYR